MNQRRIPERPASRSSRSFGGGFLRLLFAPFFFVFRTVFTFIVLSVIGFLVFYFKMHGTPEKEQQYDKIMEAMEQVPGVLGSLAHQTGLKGLADTLGYEPGKDGKEPSQEMLKNLCGQLEAVDKAEEKLPWKNGVPPSEKREDEAAADPAAETRAAEEAADPSAAEIAAIPDMAAGTETTGGAGLPPDAVPSELEPILVALKNAKNLETIKGRLSVQYVGQHGEGAVLFLDKLLEKDQGALRLAALEALRRINTPEALSVLHKHTQAVITPQPTSAEPLIVPEAPSAPAAPEAIPAPEAPAAPAPQPQEEVQW